jgi:hypothetical protein
MVSGFQRQTCEVFDIPLGPAASTTLKLWDFEALQPDPSQLLKLWAIRFLI